MHDLDTVKERVNHLTQIHSTALAQRNRLRALMDGGKQAMAVLLGQIDLGDEEMPAPHLIFSGLERLAQKLGFAPDVRVDPPWNKESTRAKDLASARQRILISYDAQSRLELQLPQVGRWLPGYGFAVWVVREKEHNGYRYPVAQLRDPFYCYPGWWGPDSQPEDLAIIRRVPTRILRRIWGDKVRNLPEHPDGGMAPIPYSTSWETQQDSGWAVVEYYDPSGTYIYIEDAPPDAQGFLEAAPNELEMPRFVVPHRPAFNLLNGQFEHTVGLMSMLAKLNVLTAIAMEDGVNTETNIIGKLRGNEYRRGRFAINEFETGTRIEKPQNNVPFQLFQQIDRLERQLRITAGYSVVDDAESPTSWVTGKGVGELQAGASRIVQEYQTILRYALQDLDRIRLRWDEVYYPNQRKPMAGMIDGAPFSETYVPATNIAGNYQSRRVYGVMAGWDDSSVIVGGLQLLQGGIIDVETFQENLRGLENVVKVNERIRKRAAESQLLGQLGERFAGGDPLATQALVEMYTQPGNFESVLKKFFLPEEEPALGEEPAPPPLPSAVPGEPIPDVQTVLSRLTAAGQAQGGAQVVSTNRQAPARR